MGDTHEASEFDDVIDPALAPLFEPIRINSLELKNRIVVSPMAQYKASDGLVGRCASHFGQVIRDDYPMNHFHAVNLFFGAVGPEVDPVQLYVDHVTGHEKFAMEKRRALGCVS